MDILSHVRFDPDILKEPRGFMRIVQVILAIFAFGTIVSVRTESTILIKCTQNSSATQVPIKYGYPFRIKAKTEVMLPFCSENQESKIGVFAGNFSASAEFFCFVGVVSFITLLLLIGGYVFLSNYFNKGTLPTKLDFVSSAAWVVIWFIASVAWADNVSKIIRYTNPSYLITELGEEYCPPGRCFAGRQGDPSNLITSVLFGFLNMGVQGACLWFIYKDTDWHRDKDGTNAGDAQADFDQPYADPGYPTPEYQTDPTVPTTPPNGTNSFGGGVPVPQARNEHYNVGGGSSFGQPAY